MDNSTQKQSITLPTKPSLGDFEACALYAKEAGKHSSRIYRVPAYIWIRFLQRSFLEVGL